ncbi:hypothetical protein VTK73DRAFT_8859 [Phialemonium thermophilum]|uniref:Uncharacterized protein n=1 Tax=Phialemonium thermophilum TaxID=223376 RepID=A0ABR3W5T7_9PEZI
MGPVAGEAIFVLRLHFEKVHRWFVFPLVVICYFHPEGREANKSPRRRSFPWPDEMGCILFWIGSDADPWPGSLERLHCTISHHFPNSSLTSSWTCPQSSKQVRILIDQNGSAVLKRATPVCSGGSFDQWPEAECGVLCRKGKTSTDFVPIGQGAMHDHPALAPVQLRMTASTTSH